MNTHDYAKLNPDTIIDAFESLGYFSDLRILALNSYENRVYQVGVEDADPIIMKFYRPNRWTDAQIKEEHHFSLGLHEQEIPIIPPVVINGETLFEYKGYRFSLYPRQGGHAPELEDVNCVYNLGQHIGRMHAWGQSQLFEYRPDINVKSYAIDSREYILISKMLPLYLEESYASVTSHLIDKVQKQVDAVDFTRKRLHGDCHPGNILMRPDSLYIVDLDDACNGPAIQDIWMLISGDRENKRKQLQGFLDGYRLFCDFDRKELSLIEPLRTLRMIHYAGWLAKRWNDPSFPMFFPWFNTERYWSDHILSLKEQLSELDEPVISLD